MRIVANRQGTAGQGVSQRGETGREAAQDRRSVETWLGQSLSIGGGHSARGLVGTGWDSRSGLGRTVA